jgi:hypothetical protein
MVWHILAIKLGESGFYSYFFKPPVMLVMQHQYYIRNGSTQFPNETKSSFLTGRAVLLKIARDLW